MLIVTHDPLVAEQVHRTVRIRDGRTSTEGLRHPAAPGAGGGLTAQEHTVPDRVGRLQLPRESTESLGLAHRVRLVLAAGHIEVWPDRDQPRPDGAGG
ncbi:hypothetical protein [Kitasatospora sp. NPDC057595]|uniref:hypothetical protein n=1 Tax=Kitasatospora sp. NPDC057595 TaxID=3346177 RepID=UPI0036CA7FD0